MKFILTGLTTGNHSCLLHDFAYVKSAAPLTISGFDLHDEQLRQGQLNRPIFSFEVDHSFRIQAKSNLFQITYGESNRKNIHYSELLNRIKTKSGANYAPVLVIKPSSVQGKIAVGIDKKFGHERIYSGELIVVGQKDHIRLILKCPVEDYVTSVLKAEMPARYQLEAIKAQAVSARTYALHPRVNHKQDFCHVCDSYLCCQGFSGWQADENPVYAQACAETSGQILAYKGEPILSLFSACAGGHTENFEDCFSDWATGIFPPQPIPYLRGVSESTQTGLVDQIIDEATLKRLWHSKNPSTFDAWSPQFRWSVKFSAQDLESTLHHRMADLLSKKDFAPFIIPPRSAIFGCVKAFSITKRGGGGTAIELTVSTSKGNWQVNKELTIRSLFKNTGAKLERLPSAKIFFDQLEDNKQQLHSLIIYGLGHGHGVGLQQVGAEGMARLEKNYTQILSHYYSGAQIERV